jgi:hypothetical protein
MRAAAPVEHGRLQGHSHPQVALGKNKFVATLPSMPAAPIPLLPINVEFTIVPMLLSVNRAAP